MKKINFNLVKIILSAILLIISLFLKDYFIAYLTLIILSYIIVSYSLYIEAIKKVIHKEFFDESLLMIIASLGAFFIGKYTEALMVMLLFELGEYLSDLAIDHSKDEITKLMDLRSDVVNIITDEKIKTIPSKEAKLKDHFIVKPAELVPLDGIIIKGKTLVNSASLTGESEPKELKEGDTILSGMINLSDLIEVEATSEYETSTASRIINLIENCDDKKSRQEKFITKFSKVYTPIVVAIALLVIIIPVLIFKQDFNTWLYRCLELLVISCPCALVISVPLAYFCAIGKASKEGILLKGSFTLDNLTKIKTVVVDKTGTITKGKFEITEIGNYSKLTDNELVELLAYGEYFSNHPIAKSILEQYKFVINEERISDYHILPGLGIQTKIDNKLLLLGNALLLKQNNIDFEEINLDKTIIYIAYKNQYYGYVIISDTIKKEAYTLVNKLNEVNINKVVMLSGDDDKIVKEVASKINISDYYSKLLPIDKVNKIEELKKDSFTAFVGDGINDAPVIKIADLGIAMGGMSNDATIEASDMVIMNDNLDSIITSIKLSILTKKIILFNIICAITIKVVMLILSLLGITPIWLAVFSDVGITLLLVLHSLTILKRKLKQ